VLEEYVDQSVKCRGAIMKLRDSDMKSALSTAMLDGESLV